MSSKKRMSSTKSESTSALVPKLRFPEYWGDSAWTEKPLKEAAQINPVNSQLPESFVYIDLESVVAGELKAKKRISRIGAPSRAQRIVQKGDIIYQVVRPYQRNNLLCEFEHDENYVASTGYAQLRAGGNNMFLYQAIQTDSFVGRVIAKCSGSSYPAINASELAEIRLPIPPTLEEQQRVALCLSSLDNLISSQARKIELLKKYKKGLLQQLFPREGETEPRLRFSEFRGTGAWEKRTLGDTCKMQAGRFVPADAISEENTGELFPCYGGNGLRGFTATYTHNGTYPLIGRQGALCGNVKLACNRFHATEHAVVASAEQGIDVVWLYYALDQLRLNRFATGQAQPGLSVDVLVKVSVVVPINQHEQQPIATTLSSLDDIIAAQSRKLEALKTHKKGLMQGLFPPLEEYGA